MINLKKVLLLYSKKFLDGEISSFPTTDSRFLPYSLGEETRMLDIKKKNDMEEYLKIIFSRIDSIQIDYFISIFVTKRYRLYFYMLFIDSLEHPEKTFLDCYTSSEYVASELDVIKNIYKKIKSKKIMTSSDLSIYKNLPNEVCIFRGHNNNYNLNNSLSWTLDINVAKWFSERFLDKDTAIYTAKVPKDKIWFFTNYRSEKEVVLKPGTEIEKYIIRNGEIK